MDSKWRNLLAVLVILAAGYLLYSNYPALSHPAADNFDSDLAGLNSVFEGVSSTPADYLHLASDVSDSLVSELQSKKSALKTPEGKALADIYIQEVEIFRVQAEGIADLDSKVLVFGDYLPADSCPGLSALNAKLADFSKLNGNYSAVYSKIDDFSSSYPAQASKSNIAALKSHLQDSESRFNDYFSKTSDFSNSAASICGGLA